MNIIGLTGRARSGKDTVGSYLLSKLPNSICLSYAYPLKKEASLILGISIEQLDYYKNNNVLYQGTNVRKLLQGIADEHREEDKLYYIKQLNTRIEKYLKQGYTNIIVTDVRFILEADELRRFGGSTVTIIKLVRDSIRIKESDHASEQEVDSIRPDYTIYNNSTLDNVYRKMNDIINNIH